MIFCHIEKTRERLSERTTLPRQHTFVSMTSTTCYWNALSKRNESCNSYLWKDSEQYIRNREQEIDTASSNRWNGSSKDEHPYQSIGFGILAQSSANDPRHYYFMCFHSCDTVPSRMESAGVHNVPSAGPLHARILSSLYVGLFSPGPDAHWHEYAYDFFA